MKLDGETTNGGIPAPSDSSTVSVTETRGGFTHTLGRFILPRASRSSFSCWYGYFRWVDDVADSTTLTSAAKEHFLDGQARLVRDLYANPKSATVTREGEAFLSDVVSFDKGRDSKLKEPILDMISCIAYDVKRVGALPAKVKLDHYIELEASSLLKTFLCFSHASPNLDGLQLPYEGIGAKWAHILRDFIPDVRAGLINISGDEARQYGIEPGELVRPGDSPAMKDWVASKVALAQSDFKLGKRNMYENRSLRYKFVMGLVCARYQSYLAIIRKDRFKLREEYPKDFRLLAAILGRAVMNSSIVLVVHLMQRLGLRRSAGLRQSDSQDA